jgi:hypothetical protein
MQFCQRLKFGVITLQCKKVYKEFDSKNNKNEMKKIQEKNTSINKHTQEVK